VWVTHFPVEKWEELRRLVQPLGEGARTSVRLHGLGSAVALRRNRWVAQRDLQRQFTAITLCRLRYVPQKAQCLAEMTDSLNVRRAFRGPVPGPLPALDGKVVDTSFGEVPSEQLRLRLGNIWRLLEQRAADPLMELPPPPCVAGAIGGFVLGGLTGAIKRTRWDRDPAQFLMVPPGSDYMLVIVRASPAPARRETSRVLGILVRLGALGFLDPAAYYATHPHVEAVTPA
jgi:hypothetical protein